MSLLRSVANTKDGVSFIRVEETLLAGDCFTEAGVALTALPVGAQTAVGSVYRDMGKSTFTGGKIFRKVQPVNPGPTPTPFYVAVGSTSKVGTLRLSVA
jgi:hypothetical protein